MTGIESSFTPSAPLKPNNDTLYHIRYKVYHIRYKVSSPKVLQQVVCRPLGGIYRNYVGTPTKLHRVIFPANPPCLLPPNARGENAPRRGGRQKSISAGQEGNGLSNPRGRPVKGFTSSPKKTVCQGLSVAAGKPSAARSSLGYSLFFRPLTGRLCCSARKFAFVNTWNDQAHNVVQTLLIYAKKRQSNQLRRFSHIHFYISGKYPSCPKKFFYFF